MTFYDNTKEDSRPFRSVQDAQGQAADDAAVAAATALSTVTTNDTKQQGIVVTPATASISSGTPTVQLTATPLATPAGTVTWTSSDPTKATVSAAGLVTRVAAGSTVITATITKTVKGINLTQTGKSVITVT